MKPVSFSQVPVHPNYGHLTVSPWMKQYINEGVTVWTRHSKAGQLVAALSEHENGITTIDRSSIKVDPTVFLSLQEAQWAVDSKYAHKAIRLEKPTFPPEGEE